MGVSCAACRGADERTSGMTDGPESDLVVRNARVYTAEPSDPWAQAVAIRGGRISWMGSDRDADWFARKATEVIDAEGRLVLPGFIDSHNHVRLGSDEDCVQLAGAATLQEVQSRITVWLAEHPDATWVEAEGLDYPNLRPVAGDLRRRDSGPAGVRVRLHRAWRPGQPRSDAAARRHRGGGTASRSVSSRRIRTRESRLVSCPGSQPWGWPARGIGRSRR